MAYFSSAELQEADNQVLGEGVAFTVKDEGIDQSSYLFASHKGTSLPERVVSAVNVLRSSAKAVL